VATGHLAAAKADRPGIAGLARLLGVAPDRIDLDGLLVSGIPSLLPVDAHDNVGRVVRDGDHIATTFYENWQAVKTESSQWFPARKRFNLLFAAHCLDDPGRSEHGIGSRGGIFSGSRVKTAP
jgi:hypothetical protein